MDQERETALEVKIDWIKKDVQEIKDRLKENYVTRAEFDPIKKIVYGVVGIILTTVIVALLAFVIKQ